SPPFTPTPLVMATRSTLILLLLTLASLIYSTPSAPNHSNPQPHTPKLRVDFEKSHYDFDNCGLPSGGRARRHGGDDYVDGMDFVVQPGADAYRGEMPWAVAILTEVSSSSTPLLCTGTLISRRHVITAAHCLSTASNLPVRVAAARCNSTDHMPLADYIRWSEVKYGGECLYGGGADCTEDMVTKSAFIKSITLFPFFTEECAGGSDVMLLELTEDVDVPHACLPHVHDVEILKGAAYHSFAWGASNGQN
ncbi:hypothetical protein PFISCL1PPCAC_292, partial [Pristionchus fissidentatus]